MNLVLVCRVLLAIVLLGSAVGKFQDLDDTRQMVRDFGLKDRFARPIGTVLPGVELAVALGLLIGPASWYAAWAAAGLMAIFCIAIGANMALGRRPGCRCFGPLLTSTIGWRTLSRNMLLLGLAAVVVLRV